MNLPSIVRSRTGLAALCALFALAAADSRPVRGTQDVPPREAPRDLKDATFQRVGDDGRIVVKKDGVDRDYSLIGVEWPEDDEQRQEARAYLDRLLRGEGVRIEPREQKFATTKPTAETATAPIPAYIRRAPDGLLVNSEVVRLGFAKVAAKPAFEQMAAFREAEKRARDAGKGVWADDAAPKPAREIRREREKPAGDGPSGKSKEPASPNVVYITPSGKRYHRQSCQFAVNGQAVSIAEAIQKGLTPCSRCDPPVKP
jgi:endonuclease YncB( thermonuclease family)